MEVVVVKLTVVVTNKLRSMELGMPESLWGN